MLTLLDEFTPNDKSLNIYNYLYLTKNENFYLNIKFFIFSIDVKLNTSISKIYFDKNLATLI